MHWCGLAWVRRLGAAGGWVDWGGRVILPVLGDLVAALCEVAVAVGPHLLAGCDGAPEGGGQDSFGSIAVVL